MLPILYHLYDPKVTWERKICWKGKILVVKTMYMDPIRYEREMDMDVEDMDTGWDLRWYPLSFYIHTVPMILGSPYPP